MLDHTVCCIKECFEKSIALGLCVNHWRLNKQYGSPVARKMHSGMFRGKSADDRFTMQIKAQPNGCVNWMGGVDQDGYGSFRGEAAGQLFFRAHRWSWAFHNDTPIPKGGMICHSCDNPRCVNPEHLVLGDALYNMRDKHAKGRARIPFGERAGHAKLTEEQAKAILGDPRTYAEIAAEYNVKPSTIGSLKQRHSWRDLKDVPVVKAPRSQHRRGVSDKLNPDIVREIRSKQLTGKAYAEKYGVTQATICDIQKRRSWAHVE